MTLQAQDKAFKPKLAYTVLTVNVIDADDSSPVFSQVTYTADVAENQPSNEVVITVTAIDADEGANAIVR